MKLANTILIVIFLLVSIPSTFLFLGKYSEYNKLSTELLEMKKSLNQQEKENSSLRQDIEALRKDNQMIEKKIRERFGWCKDGETIYRFDTPSAGGAPPPVRTPPPPL